MAMTLPEKVISYIGVTDAALEKAAAFEQDVTTKQANAEKLIPAAVDALVAHNRIQPGEREKVAALLKDPVKVLELFTKLAGHRNANELGTLGTGVDANGTQKTASAGTGGTPAQSLTNPHVGGRTTRTKQSDVNLFAGLGLSIPTE
jgi:hypothetical protein